MLTSKGSRPVARPARSNSLTCARARLVLCALTLVLSSGCSSLPTTVPPSDNTFFGINSLFADSADNLGKEEAPTRLRVLIMHGMGTTGPHDFDEFISALANRLRLVQIPPGDSRSFPRQCGEPTPPASTLVARPPQIISIDGVPEDSAARLYTYDFSASASSATPNAPTVLSISFLLWSPLTATIKCNNLEERGAPNRQAFANAAKQFIDDKLADVALYSGSYRDTVIRPSVEAGLCYFIGGAPSKNGKECSHGNYKDPTVLITHSLGGYMMMDAIDDELNREKSPSRLNAESAARKIIEKTQFIYMMANQLALLDLTSLSSYKYPSTTNQQFLGLRSGGPASGFGRMLRKFTQNWSNIRLQFRLRAHLDLNGSAETTDQTRQIVAFSDPNDILSWLVDTQNLGQPLSEASRANTSKLFLTNVYMSNKEFSVPSLFSDPVKAHTGYFENQTVLELLVCGMNKGAVGSCLPNGLN